ncbi:DNA topoisomerase III [Sedimentibacter sp. MB31-C6]|uniref:DNA topoisomerase III n=1 Tax=Sedimentibacter sp. MB31-C6 TaxID=3109366 RepID=UPI002DDDAA0F|nr:DNA topoisomerase III [Sedimentibacter sp. MB36-C1]WSI04046.1 DNA topoisomerase III [Sedimentibacter sp. MB36-C1]
MILVLAEKPSVGKDIGRVLGCNKKQNGYVEGNKYIVTWALGHLVELAEPEKYNSNYTKWNLDDLPIIPNQMKTEIIKKTGKQFKTVKGLLNRNDVNEIVIATDAGREGELVARWIIEKSNVKKPIKRLWISSVTDKAIKDGFNKLKDGRLYENLYQAALARAEADWIVGINATRALTSKYNAQLSCGRVQTPTIAMIKSLEDEIRDFKPSKYFGIEALTKDFKFIWKDKNNNTRTFNKEKCNKIRNTIKNNNLIITNIIRKKDKTFAPLLYDLTELQRDASNKFGYSAKETLSTMQTLYERHKVLTYPRTDSRYISDDIVETLKDRVKACSVGPYTKYGYKISSQSIKGSKHFVNNNKVSDHHAIIPTEQTVFLGDLSDKERKIYDLVVKRFLAVLSKPYEFEKISIVGKIGDEIFETKGKVTLSKGWKEIYGYYEDEDVLDDFPLDILNTLENGSKLKVASVNLTSGETKPPTRFTEASLLSAMENPIKFMKNSDSNLKKTIGETGGLGTVATRADIIEKLFNSYVLEKRDKFIYTTSKGKQLLDLAPVDLKSPELTAEWEQKLNKISKGNLNKNSFINEMKDYTKKIIREIISSEKNFIHDNETKSKCPDCGSYLLEVNGKKGIMLVCQNRECNYKRRISQISNARCPNCHKKLELRGEGEGKIFVCKCGYREKLSAFNKRKENEKTAISKKEASKFLAKQNNDKNESINTALADALAKLKL